MNTDHRIALLRRRLADAELSVIVVTDCTNILYLTGFEGVFDESANVACVISQTGAWIYTDFRYETAVTQACESTQWVLRTVSDSLYIRLCEDFASDGLDSLALESSVPYGRFRYISERFQGNIEVVDQWIEEIRQVKEIHEIERIKAAAALTDQAFEHILTYLVPGAVERDIALEIEIFMRQNGSDGLAFRPIVASGVNSSRPHAIASDHKLSAGDFVTIDIGAKIGGYCADMTRTVVIGKATSRQREIYELVKHAHETGVSAVRGGLRGYVIDEAARAVIEQADHGNFFGHGLGHGVGLEVHELPTVSPRGREAVLSGSVITIEPGIYVPGFGGVRIEDLVVVEDGGCVVLSNSPRELLEI